MIGAPGIGVVHHSCGEASQKTCACDLHAVDLLLVVAVCCLYLLQSVKDGFEFVSFVVVVSSLCDEVSSNCDVFTREVPLYIPRLAPPEPEQE